IALLLPITFKVEPTAAFILFAGIYYGAMYGGSTTSILLNTPGESATIVTALEGNKMARNGRAGAALATAAIGSFVAGTIGTLASRYRLGNAAGLKRSQRHIRGLQAPRRTMPNQYPIGRPLVSYSRPRGLGRVEASQNEP